MGLMCRPGRNEDAAPVTATNRSRSVLGAVRTLLADIAGPLALYYVLHACGVDDVVALVAGAIPPALSAAVTAVRSRRVEPVALLVLVVMALGVVAALIGGDPRELLARGAWLTAPSGLWTLATLWRGRPICFTVTQAVLPHRAAVMDELWDADPRFRRAWRSITVVWGTVLLADSVLRVLMAYTLPVPSVPALDTALTIATIVVLQIPTHVFLRRSGCWDQLFRAARVGSAA
jgi:hypothetical protein